MSAFTPHTTHSSSASSSQQSIYAFQNKETIPQTRDSGYGASPTPDEQPDPYHAHTPRSTATNTMYAPGVPVTEASYDLPSPVSAELEFGPDYARKDRLNSPPSEVSLHTYLVRAQHFVRHVKRLPWVAKERVTKDYVPALVQKEREDEVLRPAFVWVNSNYYLVQPERTSAVQSSKYPSGVTEGGNDPMRASASTVWDTSLPLSMPQRMSYAKLDLDDEFSAPKPPPEPVPEHAIKPFKAFQAPQVIFTTPAQQWIVTAEKPSVWPPPGEDLSHYAFTIPVAGANVAGMDPTSSVVYTTAVVSPGGGIVQHIPGDGQAQQEKKTKRFSLRKKVSKRESAPAAMQQPGGSSLVIYPNGYVPTYGDGQKLAPFEYGTFEQQQPQVMAQAPPAADSFKHSSAPPAMQNGSAITHVSYPNGYAPHHHEIRGQTPSISSEEQEELDAWYATISRPISIGTTLGHGQQPPVQIAGIWRG